MKDNQLQIVSIEQAKSLKELGFDWGAEEIYSLKTDQWLSDISLPV
jgi:hypothetical protein